MLLSGLCCLKKTYKKKADFFDFARVSLFRSEKHSLLSRISKYVSFLLVCLKKNIKKKFEFLPKTMTNPFAKCRYFRVF